MRRNWNSDFYNEYLEFVDSLEEGLNAEEVVERFEGFVISAEDKIKNLEDEVKELENKVEDLTIEIEELEKKE